MYGLAYVIIPTELASLQGVLDEALAPFRRGGPDDFSREKLDFDDVTEALRRLHAARFEFRVDSGGLSIAGDSRPGAGNDSMISSGANAGRGLVGGIARALGSKPSDVEAEIEASVEIVSALLEAARRGEDRAFPTAVVLPAGACAPMVRRPRLAHHPAGDEGIPLRPRWTRSSRRSPLPHTNGSIRWRRRGVAFLMSERSLLSGTVDEVRRKVTSTQLGTVRTRVNIKQNQRSIDVLRIHATFDALTLIRSKLSPVTDAKNFFFLGRSGFCPSARLTT